MTFKAGDKRLGFRIVNIKSCNFVEWKIKENQLKEYEIEGR